MLFFSFFSLSIFENAIANIESALKAVFFLYFLLTHSIQNISLHSVINIVQIYFAFSININNTVNVIKLSKQFDPFDEFQIELLFAITVTMDGQ